MYLVIFHMFHSYSSLIQPSFCLPFLQSYLRKHGFHVGDLHLSPYSPGSLRQAPCLLQGHIVLVINVKKKRTVHFSKAINQVVEPQAIFVVPR